MKFFYISILPESLWLREKRWFRACWDYDEPPAKFITIEDLPKILNKLNTFSPQVPGERQIVILGL
jgi:hypothetical protein